MPTLDPRILSDALAEAGLCRCLGVPDSTLEPWLRALAADSRFEHVIASNECEAMAIALGQYLATGCPSLVYLQNSGFGKTIHPITSLFSADIFNIPALLLIGWRGAPDGPPDEPQHATMGRIMPTLLGALELPYEILSGDPLEIRAALIRAKSHFQEQSTPYALVVRPGLFEKSKKNKLEAPDPAAFTRQRALEAIVEHLPSDTRFVSTTGKASRELFFLREAQKASHSLDIYTVGGMGCASSIGLGLALEAPEKTICVIDGDGAALMQLGSFATIGHAKPQNLIHLLIDNESYESTGGQPSISASIDFPAVARACGYPWAKKVDTLEGLTDALREIRSFHDLRFLCFLQIKVVPGSDPKLGRPTLKPRENALLFKEQLCKPS